VELTTLYPKSRRSIRRNNEGDCIRIRSSVFWDATQP